MSSVRLGDRMTLAGLLMPRDPACFEETRDGSIASLSSLRSIGPVITAGAARVRHICSAGTFRHTWHFQELSTSGQRSKSNNT